MPILNMTAREKKNVLLLAVTLALLLGFVDSVYLTIQHYTGDTLICTVVEGCNLVLSSPYANFLGVPTALFGISYYGALLFMFGAYLYWRDHKVLICLLLITTLGLLVSVALIYLQIAVIEAICQYCLLSALSTLVSWLGLVVLWRKQRTNS